ncbi:MAG TPA: acetate uptake transporter [Rubrobacter sp.]|nr:acetate uptake transporter [Rubrobacter sp.]
MSERSLQEDDIRRIVRAETQGAGEVPAEPGIADPAPLGLAAFALTTFLLSLFNAGLLNEAGESIVFSLALFYGGLAQFAAGMWEFKNKNTFGATAFSSYGAFWLAFWGLQQFYLGDIPEAQVGPVVGWFLIAWGIFTAYMWIGSFKVNTAVMVVFLLLTATFFLLGLGDLLGATAIGTIGGYVGIATAIAAWYASAAVVINTNFGRTVLPVGAPG